MMTKDEAAADPVGAMLDGVRQATDQLRDAIAVHDSLEEQQAARKLARRLPSLLAWADAIRKDGPQG